MICGPMPHTLECCNIICPPWIFCPIKVLWLNLIYLKKICVWIEWHFQIVKFVSFYFHFIMTGVVELLAGFEGLSFDISVLGRSVGQRSRCLSDSAIISSSKNGLWRHAGDRWDSAQVGVCEILHSSRCLGLKLQG